MWKVEDVCVVLAAMVFAAWTATAAMAQTLSAPTELELDETKKELERIIAEDPEEAANARKALEALTDPSSAGRQFRSKRFGDRGGRRIVNGVPATGYPAVGALLHGNDPGNANFRCTGTLVGCDKFLTAAHCLFVDLPKNVFDDNPQSYLVFLQELGFFKVKGIRWPKQEYKPYYASYDLAMLTLERPVEGIAPMPLNMSTSAKPLNKSIATIVGFGRTGGKRHDYGIRRIGSARTERCTSTWADKAICWKFDADVKAKGSRSNTCNGDSGGGVFMFDHEGHRRVQKIFGVVSGGTDVDHCQKNDESYNVDVAEFAAWIEAAGEGRLSSQQCGSERMNTEARSTLLTLDGSRERGIFTLEVPAGTQKLRVAMNGEENDNVSNDFNLFVYRGAQSSNAKPACAEAGPGQFGFCDIAAPAPGQWSVVVQRMRGKGKAQITATLVGSGKP